MSVMSDTASHSTESSASTASTDYKSMREFWPFYVREHANPINRALHFVGTTGVILSVGAAVVTGNPWLLALAPLSGYGCAWIGHFIVEKNRPATFKYPLYSLASDFVMYAKTWRGQMGREVAAATAGR